jgi:hypothetical protein
MSCKGTTNLNAMTSLTMLISSTVWRERDVREFQNKSAPSTILLEIIKTEATFWVLSFIISRVIPSLKLITWFGQHLQDNFS